MSDARPPDMLQIYAPMSDAAGPITVQIEAPHPRAREFMEYWQWLADTALAVAQVEADRRGVEIIQRTTWIERTDSLVAENRYILLSEFAVSDLADIRT